MSHASSPAKDVGWGALALLLLLLGLFAAWCVVQRRRALVTEDGFEDEGGGR